MRKTVAILTAFAAFLFSFASHAIAAGLPQGTFIGCAESDGVMVPVTTELGGGPEGSYLFVEEDGSRVPGSLEKGRAVGPMVEYVWHDKYGSGRLTILPTPEGDAFTGVWKPQESNESFIWWGKRGDPARIDQFDCGERKSS